MKDTTSRISAYGNVLLHCTSTLLFFIFLISYLEPLKDITSEIQIVWMSSGTDSKVARLNPNIDLSPQFNFNVKQIFLYVIAKSKDKEEMVWSKIVKNGENPKFFSPVTSNYNFKPDFSDGIEFEIRGSLFPYTGKILDVHYGSVFY